MTQQKYPRTSRLDRSRKRVLAVVSILTCTLLATTPVQSQTILPKHNQKIVTQLGGTSRGLSRTHRITRAFTEPIEISTVATSVAGVIQEIHIVEGQKVDTGDELATLNHGTLLAEKKIAVTRSESTAAIEAAKANLEIKKERLNVVESLLSTGHVNQYEIDERKKEYENAVANLKSAELDQQLSQLQVERIDAQIADRIICSPIHGIVTEVHKNLGENLTANTPEFATIVRVDQLKVRFFLDELTLNSLSEGQVVSILVGADEKKTDATVIFISPTINPDSGTGRVDLRIENSALQIRSGVPCVWPQPKPVINRSADVSPAKSILVK